MISTRALWLGPVAALLLCVGTVAVGLMVGYQAPLIAALTLRRNPHAARIVRFSFLMYGAVFVAIVANLAALAANESLWDRIEPYYGIVQRSLFASWFAWCAGFCLLLMRIRVTRPVTCTPSSTMEYSVDCAKMAIAQALAALGVNFQVGNPLHAPRQRARGDL